MAHEHDPATEAHQDVLRLEAIRNDLVEIRKKGLANVPNPDALGLLQFQIVEIEAGGSDEQAERLRALERVLRSVITDAIGGRPHPDDDAHLRAQAAELLLIPQGKWAGRSAYRRREHIETYVALITPFHRHTYEERLILQIARELADRERAVLAGGVEPVTLDVNVALRLNSSGTDALYERTLEVAQGDVVEMVTLLRLGDPIDWSHRAHELTLVIELRPNDREITYQARAAAFNAVHTPGYTPFDDTRLTARESGAISVTNLRSFQLQLSDSPSVDEFAWDAGRQLPDSWVRIWHWEEDDAWMVEIRATSDNTLTADTRDALKLSFLVDIYDPGLQPSDS